MQSLQQLPDIKTLREPSKAQICGQKCPAPPARAGFTIRTWYPLGEGEGPFYMSYPTADLEKRLLTATLYPSALHTCTERQTSHLHLGHEPRGILFLNIEGPMLPSLLLQALILPSFFFCSVCQWKKLANPIYKYFCFLAPCLMLCC